MKAILVDFSLGKEAWDKIRSKFMKPAPGQGVFSIRLVEVEEPPLLAKSWVKIRTIMAGVSDLDEGLLVSDDPYAFGSFISFPFTPGNEVLGIVTETGDDAHGLELGERVVINPVLSCEPRAIEPLCPSCSRGEPSSCRNFSKGALSPGALIGACKDTSGGWGDYVIAHKSQVRKVPSSMDSDQAILTPEFARALRAVMTHPPDPGDRVIVMGGGSLGLLTLQALRVLGHDVSALLVVEHPFQAATAKALGHQSVIIKLGPGEAYEEVADFVGASVHYPAFGRIHMEGGAAIVYETTGRRVLVEDALRFATEGGKVVMLGMNQLAGFDMAPLWFKNIRVCGTTFSGTETYNGEITNTFDLALDLASRDELPYKELVTHRFALEDYKSALSAIADRASSKALKTIFQHVV